MIKAHEIQGCIALENSFNKVGLDHVVLVKVASTAVVCQLLGLTREQTINALSLAWVDGQSLRTYRHAPNTGSRKSWAAGDATSRAVRLALMARAGEMGYPSVLTAKTWGFYDVSFRGQEFKFQRPYGSYVMENVLFKISFPAEFHAQTAVEAAMKLREQLAAARQDRRGYSQHHHPHPRGLPAHHRQEGPARQSRRSRPLRAIHGRHSAALWPAHGGRLRRRRRHRSRASTPCAPRSSASKSRNSRATITTPRSARSPMRCAWFSTTARVLEETGRVPHRPSPPPRGGHAAAGGEIQNQPAPAV